jgi:glycosyltransferase involved in cell wall biosynthesis
MIDVTAHLQNDGYDVCLWLLGPVKIEGGENELQRRLNGEGHADYVRVLGPVDHSEVYSYQRNADIGLVYMQKEADGERYYWRGLPTKMVEYMYAELPVVATDTIGVRNYLPDECGIKIPYKEIEAQADAISDLLESPAQRTKMGKEGRKHVEEHMSWDVESDKLLSFYRELLNGD